MGEALARSGKREEGRGKREEERGKGKGESVQWPLRRSSVKSVVHLEDVASLDNDHDNDQDHDSKKSQ